VTDIIFSDLFKNESSKKFNITEEEVRQTITGCDDYKRINLGSNQQILIYLKKLSAGYYLLVDCQLKGNQNIVQCAYKIYPDLFAEFASNEPMIVLEKFAQKYGLTIQIGNHEEKFTAGDSFPAGTAQSTQNIVRILNPSNHSFIQSMMIRMRDEGGLKYVDVSLAYCIDTTEYLNYLSANS